MKVLITGGAGFTGCNCAAYFAGKGFKINVLDDLSRMGSALNLKWLRSEFAVDFIRGDIRNQQEVNDIIAQKGPFDLIIHLAAQVAVTTSVLDPWLDFNTNAVGTFNLLEAMRKYNPEAALIYSSTNKVYGNMEDLEIIEKNGRYNYRNLPAGIEENRQLDFHSPYGCSKGAADQYCRDYARIYGLRTVVLRQSCIYGFRQFGVEDQGWVAWFCIANVLDRPITIYGDGKQVRDILFIDDLIRLYEIVYERIDDISGSVFNIGGGTENTLSLLELISNLENLSGKHIPLKFVNWRPGDQRIYVSNISKAQKKLGWKPVVKTQQGVEKLYGWLQNNKELFA